MKLVQRFTGTPPVQLVESLKGWSHHITCDARMCTCPNHSIHVCAPWETHHPTHKKQHIRLDYMDPIPATTQPIQTSSSSSPTMMILYS